MEEILAEEKLIEMLNQINFDKEYIEATFQYKLLMKLAKKFDEDTIFPERNIAKYELEKLSKKEIDIVIESGDSINIAMELKMPMNGQYPEQMYKFVEDIKFLEELKASKKFSQCFFIVVTNDKNFWEGKKSDSIYSFFRKNEKLKGQISKPTGDEKDMAIILSGEYNVVWKMLKNDFHYFIIEI